MDKSADKNTDQNTDTNTDPHTSGNTDENTNSDGRPVLVLLEVRLEERGMLSDQSSALALELRFIQAFIIPCHPKTFHFFSTIRIENQDQGSGSGTGDQGEEFKIKDQENTQD